MTSATHPPITLSHLGEYFSHRPIYQDLCVMASEKITKTLEHRGIPFASISKRVKAFRSMMVKLEEKEVKPGSLMGSLRDTAGLRIVIWRDRDRSAVGKCIRETFDVQDGTKEASLNPSVVTYNDDKYYCKLRKARGVPKKLEGLRFELQVQTAMMSVWATLSHDIYYKPSIDLPEEFRRRLDLLIGLANLADYHTGSLVDDVEDHGLTLSSQHLNVIGLKRHLDDVTDTVDRQKVLINDFTDSAGARMLVGDLEKCGVVKQDDLKHLVNQHTVEQCLKAAAGGKQLDYSDLVRLILMLKMIDEYFTRVAPEIVPLDEWQLPILETLGIDYEKAAKVANKSIYIFNGKELKLLKNE